MESDSFFWQLFKALPDTLFDLLGEPVAAPTVYHFEALEVKKSYRLDGLFIPTRPNLPLYFLEALFRRDSHFYTNLFAKVFAYLDKHKHQPDWRAVALFENRRTEPKRQVACEVLIESRHMRRFYLDELSIAEWATPGLTLLKLVTIPKPEAPVLVERLIEKAKSEEDCERGRVIVELVEELLMRRFTELDREEGRRMFKLHDLRESKVWQEAEKVGLEKGKEQGKQSSREELVHLWLADGKTIKEIAELLHAPVAEVRRLARRSG